MSRTDTNLDISKKENGVIFLEENYNEKYKGFDPNNPATLLGLKILQEEFLYQSIELASEIENNFISKNNRYSRGVKQQPIWVLDATVMPGVLIELGFVSHPDEGKYISSEIGKEEMSQSISNAIITYKNNFYTTKTESVTTTETNSGINNTANTIVENNPNDFYKVQICALNKKIDTNSSNFKGLNPISFEKVKNTYKYFYANETDYEICKEKLEEAKKKGFSSAFIVKFTN